MEWVESVRRASYDELRKQVQILREKIEKRRGNAHDVDMDMVRLQIGKEIGDLIEL